EGVPFQRADDHVPQRLASIAHRGLLRSSHLPSAPSVPAPHTPDSSINRRGAQIVPATAELSRPGVWCTTQVDCGAACPGKDMRLLVRISAADAAQASAS